MNEETKELLELAAKAMGYRVKRSHPSFVVWIDGAPWGWNPIENSDDCFEMECKLRIDIQNGDDWVSAQRGLVECTEAVATDRTAARRMASIRVAAELGRRME